MNEIEIAIRHADIQYVSADLLILKHASGFFGADRAVAETICDQTDELSLETIEATIESAGHALIAGNGAIEAKQALFVKSVPLTHLRYEQVREFTLTAMRVAADVAGDSRHVAMTIHGVGYGLNAAIAFLAQIAGLVEAIGTGHVPNGLKGISIVELEADTASYLTGLLAMRFMSEPYVRRSVTGSIIYLDAEKLQRIYQDAGS